MALVVDDKNDDASKRFFEAVDQAIPSLSTQLSRFSVSDNSAKMVRVAFDCEGVNLCRIGTIELVAICFEEPMSQKHEVFLVDLNGNDDNPKRKNRIQALKKLFECKDVQKVIHDSRMDCDALYHLHGISVVNVHDTSCCHWTATRREDVNLNDVLYHHGMEENGVRDKSVYKSNPAFWATRPLTDQMIHWSSSDVNKLLAVANKQKNELERLDRYKEALDKSLKYTTMVRDMKLERGLVCKVHIGRFIGTRGSNLRSLQKRTNTMVYQDQKVGRRDVFMVFYNDLSSLNLVKTAMGH